MSAPVSASTTQELTPPQAAALLGTALTTWESMISTMPPALLTWRPAPGEWCAQEIVGHLIETEERGFGGRIRTILTQDRPRFTTWDPDEVAAARRDAERDPAELLGELARRRRENIALVETLTGADLERGGDHPAVGFLTVRDLLHEWVFHDGAHLQQLLANIQAYTWPHMGNCQRFSAPEAEGSGAG
jgi:hypothetical protein